MPHHEFRHLYGGSFRPLRGQAPRRDAPVPRTRLHQASRTNIHCPFWTWIAATRPPSITSRTHPRMRLAAVAIRLRTQAFVAGMISRGDPASYAEAVGAVHGPWVAAHRRHWPLASIALHWARSSGRHAPRQRLEPGDPSSAETEKKVARKVFAQLALSISLISDGLRLPSIDRLPKVAARPADRAPYSLIVFGTGGGRSPLFARNAHSYGGGRSVARSAG